MALIQTTINQLRTGVGLNPVDQYYTTDEGQEGFWFADGTGALTDDNTGTVLFNNTNNQLFKRTYDEGFVNVKWFGAKGDETADDIDAIQAAIDYITYTTYVSVWDAGATTPHQNYESGGGEVFFPGGKYRISKNILVGQHCKLLGVSKGGYGYFNASSTDHQNGSVIVCDFAAPEDNEQQWAIQTACYWTNSPTQPILSIQGKLIEKDFAVKPVDFDGVVKPPPNPDNEKYPPNLTNAIGVTIEGLIIDGNGCYGGIKLSGAPSSLIRNVEVFQTKIGFMLSACWGSAIENCYTEDIYWYGAVICSCNGIKVSGCYFDGRPNYIPLNFSELAFNTVDYSDLNTTAQYGSTGIFCLGVSALSLHACVIEYFDNGIFAAWTSLSTQALFLEAITNYGIVLKASVMSNFTQSTFVSMPYAFFIGPGPVVSVDTAKILASVQNLIVDNDPDYRQVIFNQVRTELGVLIPVTGKRIYKRDIIFLDEVTGSVYVDPVHGNDINFGYSDTDAVKTFDAALIRVQNSYIPNTPYQKAIYDRINTIYIKAAPPISGEGSPITGAALKNINLVSIENNDLLITSYGVDETHPKARIYFQEDWRPEREIIIGQIELLGNVNLYFRNVDLVINDIPPMGPSTTSQLSIFGLKNAYGKVTFESNNAIPSTVGNIILQFPYFLFQSNPNISGSNPARSLLDVKFVNISLVGGSGLSSNIVGIPVLGVDCVQINSVIPAAYYSLPGNGWQDAIIIRNNF